MSNYVESKAYFSANNEKCPNYIIAKKITNIRSRFFSFELEDQRSCNVFVEKKSYISRQQIDRKISKGILFFYPNETKVERGGERGTRIIGSNRERRGGQR